MPNALIYSPGFDGHRQVHVFVYAHILRELGLRVFVAGDISSAANTEYIRRLGSGKEIVLIDTAAYPGKGLNITYDQFRGLQDEYAADLTIFAEADHHIRLFTSPIFNRRKRLRGRTVGLFLRPFYFYSKTSFINKLRYLKHLPSQWRGDDRLFHDYFLKKYKLLDAAFYFDEKFVSRHSYSTWVPDVYQRYAEELVKDASPGQRVWIERLKQFKEAKRDRFIFFYFGTAQYRRGYDLLLKLAVDSNACFVHCGLNNDREKYEFDTSQLKKTLSDRNALMETNEYISDPSCIEYFFKSVTHLVLPYRNFLGSSGVMLQALNYGIPVLVPDTGVMGYLVNKYQVGLSYKTDYNSLSEKFKEFTRSPDAAFKQAISAFMQTQTPEELKRILINSFRPSK